MENSNIDFNRKYMKAILELQRTEIWRNTYLPPLHRIVKKLGIQVRPPHYSSFVTNVLRMSIFFSIVWGLSMHLFVWNGVSVTIFDVFFKTALAGLFFGLWIGSYYWNSFRSNSLSKWDEL